MGDSYGEYDKTVASLYLQLAEALKEGNQNAVIITKAKIEKAEKGRADMEKHPLYSSRKDKVVSYPEKVQELNESYEDLCFELSDNSKESIKTIKEFSVEEMVNFNKRVLNKMKKNGRNSN